MLLTDLIPSTHFICFRFSWYSKQPVKINMETENKLGAKFKNQHEIHYKKFWNFFLKEGWESFFFFLMEQLLMI